MRKKINAVNPNDLKINQRVKRDYAASWVYWVTEMKGEQVLIRTTERIDDPEYDDFWVDINELRSV